MKKTTHDINKMSVHEARLVWEELNSVQQLEIVNRVSEAMERFVEGMKELYGGM